MKLTTITVMFVAIHVSTQLWAGDDPSIKGQQRIAIKVAMNEHISVNMVNN